MVATPSPGRTPAADTCPTCLMVAVLDGKWKVLLLTQLLGGPKRPSALERLVPGASRQALAHQLRQLEEDGLVAKTVYAEAPPRVEYTLTAFGQLLRPILEQLCQLGRYYAQSVRPNPVTAAVHCVEPDACGAEQATYHGNLPVKLG